MNRTEWVGAAERWLSAEERRAAAKMADQDVRAQHVIGRSITRVVAALQTGSDPRDVCLEVSAQGKPLLPADSGFYVNVAHSARVVAVAATTRAAIGVDVELPTATVLSPQRLAERVLAPAEAERLATFTGDKAVRELARYWVVKEAVGKAMGVRLLPALAGVELRPDGDALRLIDVRIGPPVSEWTLYQGEVPGGAELLAVALPAAKVSVIPINWLDPGLLRRGLVPEGDDQRSTRVSA